MSNEMLAECVHRLIPLRPTFGYRWLWALSRFGTGIPMNRKTVYLLLRLNGWFVNQRVVRPRLRLQGLKSRSARQR
jgi:hypothetical protein